MDKQISWLTKQGFTAAEIDEVIASEVIQEEASQTAKEEVADGDKEIKGGHMYRFIDQYFRSTFN